MRLEEDRVVLEPVPVEVFAEERMGEFPEASPATLEEISTFRKGWGLE